MQTLKSRLETVVYCFDKDFHGFMIKNSKSDTMKWLMRFNLPYTIQEHSPGEYLLLNREYKPLGFMTRSGDAGAGYANYDDHTLVGKPSLIDDYLYFYTDSTTPWESQKSWQNYQKRVLDFLEKISDLD
ncbi:hypothetical protein O6D91_20865 [Cronobacter sakazakii]|uniref:hypothetical protein n=1 Tax=Cronobacter sakazakii TaxID=28141 RepID=UPI0009B9382E|nr:hypothetical protein [Cronobacter sakazakii]MCZ6132159.1 hypothetical protein [Cronobacter sakazakii]MCZ6139918.1 hypothetical protein [Cronobacter sakazakii]PUX81480.1 hypothetical protein BTK64_19940 [Cronobacter sakazakii]